MPLDDARWAGTLNRAEVRTDEAPNFPLKQPESPEPQAAPKTEVPVERLTWRRVTMAMRNAWTAVRNVRLVPEPVPVDARVSLLEKALHEVKKNKNNRLSVVAFIRSQPASPAAIHGALEAIRAVSGHPVNADLRYARYSCDTSCMSRVTVKRYLTHAIEWVKRDQTRFITS